MSRVRQWEVLAGAAFPFASGGGAVGDFQFPTMPVYSALDSDHVLHAFEDYSTYSVIGDLGVNNRVDGGGPWGCVPDFKSFSGTELDPWFGTKRLIIDYQTGPPVGQSLGHGMNLEELGGSPPQYLNGGASAKESVILESAFKFTGTAPYVGKILDWQPYAGTDRFNFQTGRDCMGHQMVANHCSDDDLGLCPLFFSGTLPGTMTPVFPGMNPPGSPVVQGYAYARSIPGFDTYFYPQNANYGTGAGLFAAGGSGDATCGINCLDDTWRRFVTRLSMNVGDVMGFGRIEQWIQKSGENPVKVMEYIGDSGQRAAGKVYGRDTSVGTHTWITSSCTLHYWNLTAQQGIFDGGLTLHLGYFRCWSQSKPALP